MGCRNIRRIDRGYFLTGRRRKEPNWLSGRQWGVDTLWHPYLEAGTRSHLTVERNPNCRHVFGPSRLGNGGIPPCSGHAWTTAICALQLRQTCGDIRPVLDTHGHCPGCVQRFGGIETRLVGVPLYAHGGVGRLVVSGRNHPHHSSKVLVGSNNLPKPVPAHCCSRKHAELGTVDTHVGNNRAEYSVYGGIRAVLVCTGRARAAGLIGRIPVLIVGCTADRNGIKLGDCGAQLRDRVCRRGRFWYPESHVTDGEIRAFP